MSHKSLRDVNDPFFVKDGTALKSLYDLERELRNMSAEQFSHHVNSAKNDFYSWIHHTINDHDLSLKLSKINNQKKMADIVEKHILSLEQAQTTKKAAVQKKTISSLRRIASKPVAKVELDLAPLKHERRYESLLNPAPVPMSELPSVDSVEDRLRSKLAALPNTTVTITEPQVEAAQNISAPETVEEQSNLMRHLVHYSLGLMAGILAGLVLAKFFI